MNKLLSLLSLSIFTLASFAANAQDSTIVVGNPDSDNALMIEQDYVVSPSTAPAAPVAPAPQPVVIPASEPSMMESISETNTPDSQEIDVETTETDY